MFIAFFRIYKIMNRLVLHTFLCLAIHLFVINADVDPELLCTSEFCAEAACKPTSDYCEIQNATHSGVNLPSVMFCNCCPYCLENILKDEQCTKGSLGTPPPDNICGPGLFCEKIDNIESKCVRMESECHSKQNKYDEDRESGQLGFLEQRAICDEDGDYGPVVCIPAQTCFCQNKYGERIFGEVVNEKSVSQDMSCACARNFDLTDRILSKYNYGGPRCLPDGSYDRLQCVGKRCFCVFQETGLLSSSVIIDLVAQSLTLLPCYDSEIHHSPKEYLKPCEKERADILEILQEYKKEGFQYLGNPLPSCQPDGNYYKIQINGTRQVCVTPEGQQIDDFGADLNTPEANNMKCNCARTLHLLRTEGGVYHPPSCDSTGNWEKQQCRRNYCYCVDEENGIQNNIEQETSEDLKCK